MIGICNVDDAQYYDKLFKVSLWTGVSYYTEQYKVYANNEQDALHIAVKYAEEEGSDALISLKELDMTLYDLRDDIRNYIEENEDADEISYAQEILNLIYVDATLEGAEDVYWVYGENLNIEDITYRLSEGGM